MAELSNPTAVPVVELRGDEFLVYLDPDERVLPHACKLRITCRDKTEFSLDGNPKTDSEGRHCAAFRLTEVRIPYLAAARLVFGSGDGIDIADRFVRYQLDENKLNDNRYLTGTLFNAATRPFSDDDLFAVAYAYLNALPIDNPNFGGLITIVSYRIADKLRERIAVLDDVYATYCRYRKMTPAYDPVAFRWLVSSSNVLATVLLSVGRVQQAEDVVDGALQTIVHPSLNPMVHQNYVLLLFQGGLIKAWSGCFKEAASLFIGAVNACRHGLIDLLHPKNEWVLGQMSDCHKLLHFAEIAHVAALACTRNQLPPPSRFASIAKAPKFQMNFRLLLERFECFKQKTPPFFEEALWRIQAQQAEQ
jgi:hypothetical protein